MRIARWGIVLVATLVLAGCATGSGQEPGDGQTRSTSPTRSAPANGEPTAEPTGTPPSDTGTSVTIVLDETGSGASRTLELTCDPPGGDHPDPAAACAALTAAGGAAAFAAPPRDETCTEIYGGPQVAFVEGTVDGQTVRARFSRTNGCEISRWDALGPLLGSTGGVM